MLTGTITDEEVATIKRELGPRASDSPAMQIIKRLEDLFASYEPDMVDKAREQYGDEGRIEIDEGATCSRGSDPGLYVQAWVWVYDDE